MADRVLIVKDTVKFTLSGILEFATINLFKETWPFIVLWFFVLLINTVLVAGFLFRMKQAREFKSPIVQSREWDDKRTAQAAVISNSLWSIGSWSIWLIGAGLGLIVTTILWYLIPFITFGVLDLVRFFTA